jgi:hypothetical protein
MFASENLFEHLARGLIGFGAVALAVYIGLKPGLGFAVVSLGLGAAALVAAAQFAGPSAWWKPSGTLLDFRPAVVEPQSQRPRR